MRVNPPFIKALAESKSLMVLSLTLGSKNKASALGSLHMHPALQELNLNFSGFSEISLHIHLPSLQTLRMYRIGYSPQSWRDFFQVLCKSRGNGGSNGPNPTLIYLPNLQFLHINSGHSVTQQDSAMPQLLRPEVLAALPRSKLVSIQLAQVSPGTAGYLSQWQALGPRNSLGQLITLTIGEPLPWGQAGDRPWFEA
ncbi:hypothetical protein B484DRAFT_435926 [Ochromonadaceae sp. CCMP2298]|nr:hypothetical protein B484DRAFT_435926 [Ochromonadaceae sp. CCMP2298]